jgi:type I pantothenate kinase
VTGGSETGRSTPSPYVEFDRAQWSALRASTPLTLAESDVAALRGLNEPFELSEVEEVYLPLTRLLNLRFAATRDLRVVTETFLGHLHARVPYVIGIGGSVAAGKSTIARLLQALLGRWTDHPRVDLVTTDGFLFPNAVLEARGLMSRKGFPESYDVRALLAFLAALKAGEPEVRAPVYSHLIYDVVDGDENVLSSPDIVIVEGVNVLQTPARRGRTDASLVVSDFFDFSIYVDASEHDLEHWYVTRLLLLRETSLHDPRSYFNFLTRSSEDETRRFGSAIWREINLANLRENIAPSRERANLVLEKGTDHRVKRVRLRKL